ncbi:SGNH/GDSL hydrolase family protein [Paenibacillus sp. J22TS3]|uniref:SGNH/GDSL hydrolase family protein n=1 Tax=Paenibacillus sp. J22TS3 TaxID=2807192 RepID=UPI001B1A6E56|nr:SGNH/GDSL hydrolase family protein [Paenibacillus sp. J22TS3]GIP23799.1 lipase [Paenibacillus sp. J22TS3]
MTFIGDNDIVLFQGDSITDAGRDYYDERSLGTGYALMTAAEFGRRYPRKQVQFLNRGISGNRVVDLQGRWREDCLKLRPTWVSIYIGINDTWRKYDSNDPTTAESFYRGYRDLIVQTKEELNANLILMEPFVLPVPKDRSGWREDLDPKIQAVRELSREFKTFYVPLDGLFNAASSQVSPAYWAEDGVHPTPAGHALISQAWLQAVQA